MQEIGGTFGEVVSTLAVAAGDVTQEVGSTPSD